MGRDYFEDHFRKNKGQPKFEIADYVESNGILVPRRFSSLSEARRSGVPVLVRSEHPVEYSGPSGLLESLLLHEFPDAEDMDSLKDQVFNYVPSIAASDHSTSMIMSKNYCHLLGIPLEKFFADLSYSLWELVAGYRQTMVADDAVPNRYHLLTFRDDDNWLFNYSIIRDRVVEQSHISPLTERTRSAIPQIIDVYESVRHLPKFDSNHCPMVEFVFGDDGRLYFLQYHKSRDFKASEFVLERGPKKGEFEVDFVRGATSEGGLDVRVNCYYPFQEFSSFHLLDEEGSADWHYNKAFSELMVRKRKLQVLFAPTRKGSVRWELLKVVTKHNSRSKLFKPQVSAIVLEDKIMMDGFDASKAWRETVRTGKCFSIDVHIESDGNKAYIQRM